MAKWAEILKSDPGKTILSSGFGAIIYFYKKDIQEITSENKRDLWRSTQAGKILSKQNQDGSWSYPGGKDYIRSKREYASLETYRQLGLLVEKYGFNRKHPSIEKACEFLLGFQTDKGDIRCIYANQYSPNYTAGMLELLLKSGYEKDKRIEKCFEWLISIRQDDGGWVIPFRTVDNKSSRNLTKIFNSRETIEPDKTKPFSHLTTGVVLRAFAAHKSKRYSKAAKKAGALLKKRFFRSDKYPDRKDSSFWEKIRYPFWYTDILSSLDSLSIIGFRPDDLDIKRGVGWLLDMQLMNGLWSAGYIKRSDKEKDYWVTLAVCRVLKRLFG